MDIQSKQPSAKGPAEWFTGDVWIDAIARGEEPSHIRVSVHFTPGARTAWLSTPSAGRCTSPRARGSWLDTCSARWRVRPPVAAGRIGGAGTTLCAR